MATDSAMTGQPRSRLAAAGWYLLLSAMAAVVLFPLYITVIRALSGTTTTNSLVPVDLRSGAFSDAWSAGDLGPHLAISLVTTLCIVALQVGTSVLAAYAFTFLKFPLKRSIFAIVIATLLLPIEVTLLTNFRDLQPLGWVGPSQGLVGAMAALVLPFGATALGIFLLRQGFAGIPRDLRDAAALDGWGHLGFIRHVALPVSRPVVASFIVISFLDSYNQYVWPSFVGNVDKYKTAQVVISGMYKADPQNANLAFAAALLISLPVLALLIFFQKQIVAGLTAGAVKG